jgi:hypothetical protein
MAKKKVAKKASGAAGKPKAVKKKAKSAKSAAPAKKKPAKKPARLNRVPPPADKLPANMTSNQQTVGKGHQDEPVPAIAKRVKKKPATVGKSKRVVVPVRTGTAGGRPGGGGTGELSPARDTAAGRGYGQKRKQR